MMFGSVLETTGILRVLAGRMLERVRGTSGLILTTLGTSFGDQRAGLRSVHRDRPARPMFRSEYERRGLDPKTLSRTPRGRRYPDVAAHPLEHVRRVHGNHAGCAHARLCPFAFFNLLNPLVAALYGILNVAVAPRQTGSAVPPGSAGA